MSNALLGQEILEAVSQLPDDQAREVLDFAAFVAQRNRVSEWHDLQNAQLSALTELWDNDEDEVWNEA
jgi:hypothetical protein